MVTKGLGKVFSSCQYIMIYYLFRCIMYISHIHSEAFFFVSDHFFLQRFSHKSNVFFLFSYFIFLYRTIVLLYCSLSSS